MTVLTQFTCDCLWFYKRRRRRRRGTAPHYPARSQPDDWLADIRELNTVYLADIGRLFVLFGSEPYHVATKIGFQFATGEV